MPCKGQVEPTDGSSDEGGEDSGGGGNGNGGNGNGGGEGSGGSGDGSEGTDPSPAVSSPVGLRYKHPMEWRATYDDATRQVRVIRSSGSTILFQAPAGSCEALPVGSSRKLSYRVQLLGSDLTPCTSGTPAFLNLALHDGSGIRFNASTGEVDALFSQEGTETTAEEYAAHWQVNRNPRTGAIESIWSDQEGLLQAVPQTGGLLLCHYAPEDVIRSDKGLRAEGTPLVTYKYEKYVENGATVLKTTRQSRGRQPFVTERRTLGDNVTVITGEGPERIIRTIVKRALPGGKWETIDTTRREGDAEPSTCVRIVKKYTPGGWLDLSRTEGYGTDIAQTTINTYNDQYRVALQVLPDGGYTRFEYDAQGRVIAQASPWVGGGEKVIRTVYADLKFNDFRPSSETELIRADDGTETILHTRTLMYEDTPEVLRVTTTETAIGAGETRTGVRETFGPAAPYAYSRGRIKSVLTHAGILKSYEYAAETAYGAAHRVTVTVTASGRIVPGQSTRSVSYIRADGKIVCEEEFVHAGGEFRLIKRDTHDYDAEGHRCRTTHANGRASSTEWMCSAPLRETDEDGVVTTYGYDSARHLVETIRSATATTPETITTYTTDAAGRTLTKRKDTGALTTITKTQYDILGRITEETDELGRVTTRGYRRDLLMEFIMTPNGAVLATTRHYDGSIITNDGSGQPARRHTYEITAEGILQTTHVLGGSNWVASQRITRNGFGDCVLEEHAHTLGGFVVTRRKYDAAGREIETQTDGLAPTVTSFDSMGNRKKTVLVLHPDDPENPLCNRVTETSLLYENKADGVYQTEVRTVYDAEGRPVVSSTSTLVSQLSVGLRDKTVSTSPRGQVATMWTEYGIGPVRVSYATNPAAEATSIRREVDGFVTEETDFARLKRRYDRTYTARGMILRATDPRGNITTVEMDVAGRETARTDAAGNVTRLAYKPFMDVVSTRTNPDGTQIFYRTDFRGRLVAQWGSGTQPLCLDYDSENRVTCLTTFRSAAEDITDDPSSRTDGDRVRWQYHPATGLPVAKTLPGGHSTTIAYDAWNRMASTTQARGTVTWYAYKPGTGELESVKYSDQTSDCTFGYDHLGRLRSVSDASGPAELAYDHFGTVCAETSESMINVRLDYNVDTLGRDAGYRLTVDGHTIQDIRHSFEESGRLSAAAVAGLPEPFGWSYGATTGVTEVLAYPNLLFRENVYLPRLNLIGTLDYSAPGIAAPLVKHNYAYDSMMRPIQHRISGNTFGAEAYDYAYNSRGELTGGELGAPDALIGYRYDNNGNRTEAREAGQMTTYATNARNQYELISENDGDFRPEYDADGNQTLLQTTTGIWKVSYDAENRPWFFEQQGGTLRVECVYDFRGRRRAKAVWNGAELLSRKVFLYKGYLQIAEIDAMTMAAGLPPAVRRSYFWDPTEPFDTRPLMMTHWEQGEGNTPVVREHLFYTHDNHKNVSALVDSAYNLRARYRYAPLGGILSSTGDAAEANPWRFSSEYMDDELGLTYYIFRYQNAKDGRWITRDPLGENAGLNLYAFLGNAPGIDRLGLSSMGGGSGGSQPGGPVLGAPQPGSPFYPFPKKDPSFSEIVLGDAASFSASATVKVQVGEETVTTVIPMEGNASAKLSMGEAANNTYTGIFNLELKKAYGNKDDNPKSHKMFPCCDLLNIAENITSSVEMKATAQWMLSSWPSQQFPGNITAMFGNKDSSISLTLGTTDLQHGGYNCLYTLSAKQKIFDFGKTSVELLGSYTRMQGQSSYSAGLLFTIGGVKVGYTLTEKDKKTTHAISAQWGWDI